MKCFWKRTVCLALTLALFAGLLPLLAVGASAETLEERQQAVVAVAMAYFDKGHNVQYDGSQMLLHVARSDGGYTRQTNQVSPEYATPNETMYTVCSDFPHQVYWEAFRYLLCGYNAGTNKTATLMAVPRDDPMTVWKWEKADGTDPADEIDKMMELAQPGDIFTAKHANGGHTMLCVGDVLGDGKKYFAHSAGSRFRQDPLQDRRECFIDDPTNDKRCGITAYRDANGGSIRLTAGEPEIRKQYGNEARTAMNLIRPLNVMTEKDYPIREATRYRMTHPRMYIDRCLNKSRLVSAYPGETVTMTIRLKNDSKETYTVPVTEKTPKGAKLKTPFEGAQVSGDTQKWDVELAPGGDKVFTCEYEITAKQYETVCFEGGSVGDIPSNSILIQVGGKKLTEEENTKLAAIAKGEYNDKLAAAGANNNNLGDVVYQQILGLNVRFPQYGYVMRNLVKKVKTRSGVEMRQYKTPADASAEELTMDRMLVPTAWGGMEFWYEWGNERINDPRDFHLDPGDVILRAKSVLASSAPEQLVYLGDGKYLSYDPAKNEYPIVEEPEFFKCITYLMFCVLRPTLAYEDVHKLPALPAETDAVTFEDVTGRDWFYTYVRELAADGTVNGMTETTFEPQGTLTYGQALKLVALAVGEKEPAKTGEHWASGYMTLAKEKKWLDGDVDPDRAITRAELCGVLARAKGLTAQPKKNPFKDTKDEAVLALYKAGVINGMTKTEFQPEGKLTRAQIAKIICALREVNHTQTQQTEAPQNAED